MLMMKNFYHTLVFLLLWSNLICSPADSVTFYINNNGTSPSSPTGSIDSPFPDIESALSALWDYWTVENLTLYLSNSSQPYTFNNYNLDRQISVFTLSGYGYQSITNLSDCNSLPMITCTYNTEITFDNVLDSIVFIGINFIKTDTNSQIVPNFEIESVPSVILSDLCVTITSAVETTLFSLSLVQQNQTSLYSGVSINNIYIIQTASAFVSTSNTEYLISQSLLSSPFQLNIVNMTVYCSTYTLVASFLMILDASFSNLNSYCDSGFIFDNIGGEKSNFVATNLYYEMHGTALDLLPILDTFSFSINNFQSVMISNVTMTNSTSAYPGLFMIESISDTISMTNLTILRNNWSITQMIFLWFIVNSTAHSIDISYVSIIANRLICSTDEVFLSVFGISDFSVPSAISLENVLLEAENSITNNIMIGGIQNINNISSMTLSAANFQIFNLDSPPSLSVFNSCFVLIEAFETVEIRNVTLKNSSISTTIFSNSQVTYLSIKDLTIDNSTVENCPLFWYEIDLGIASTHESTNNFSNWMITNSHLSNAMIFSALTTLSESTPNQLYSFSNITVNNISMNDESFMALEFSTATNNVGIVFDGLEFSEISGSNFGMFTVMSLSCFLVQNSQFSKIYGSGNSSFLISLSSGQYESVSNCQALPDNETAKNLISKSFLATIWNNEFTDIQLTSVVSISSASSTTSFFMPTLVGSNLFESIDSETIFEFILLQNSTFFNNTFYLIERSDWPIGVILQFIDSQDPSLTFKQNTIANISGISFLDTSIAQVLIEGNIFANITKLPEIGIFSFEGTQVIISQNAFLNIDLQTVLAGFALSCTVVMFQNNFTNIVTASQQGVFLLSDPLSFSFTDSVVVVPSFVPAAILFSVEFDVLSTPAPILLTNNSFQNILLLEISGPSFILDFSLSLEVVNQTILYGTPLFELLEDYIVIQITDIIMEDLTIDNMNVSFQSHSTGGNFILLSMSNINSTSTTEALAASNDFTQSISNVFVNISAPIDFIMIETEINPNAIVIDSISITQSAPESYVQLIESDGSNSLLNLSSLLMQNLSISDSFINIDCSMLTSNTLNLNIQNSQFTNFSYSCLDTNTVNPACGIIQFSSEDSTSSCDIYAVIENTVFSGFLFQGNDSISQTSIENLNASVILINYQGETSVTLSNSKISGSITNGGPALLSLQNAQNTCQNKIIINNSEFADNIAINNGGAISSSASPLMITNSQFYNNTSIYGTGSAIYIQNVSCFSTSSVQEQIYNSSNTFSENFRYTFNVLYTDENPVGTIPSTLSIYNMSTTDLNSFIFNNNIVNASTFTLQNTQWQLALLDYLGLPVLDPAVNFKLASITSLNQTYTSLNCNQQLCNITNPNLILSGTPDTILNITLEYSSATCTPPPIVLTATLRPCILGEITSGTNATQQCIPCPFQTYSLNPQNDQCNVCPQFAQNCSGGSQIYVKSGYWRMNTTSSIIVQCRYPEACVGGVNSSCAEGYVGPLCQSCDNSNGFSRKNTDECGSCPNYQYQSLIISVGILILILVYIFYDSSQMYSLNLTLAQVNLEDNLNDRLLQYHKLEEKVIKDNSSQDIVGSEKMQEDITNKQTQLKESIKSSIYLRLLITYSQILQITLVSILGINNASWVQQTEASVNVVANPTTTLLFSTTCTFLGIDLRDQLLYLETIFIVLVPIFLIVLVVLLMLVLWIFKSLLGQEKFRINDDRKYFLVNVIICIITLVQPSVLQALLKFLQCTPLPGYGDDILYINSDLGYECWSGDYEPFFFEFIIPNLIIWVAGIPTVLFYILWKNKMNLNTKKMRLCYGATFKGFREEVYYWGIATMMLKVLLISASSVLYADPKTNALTLFAILYGFYYISKTKEPYNDQEINKTEQFSVVCYILTIFCGIYMNDNESIVLTVIGAIVILTSNFWLILILCGAILSTYSKRAKHYLLNAMSRWFTPSFPKKEDGLISYNSTKPEMATPNFSEATVL